MRTWHPSWLLSLLATALVSLVAGGCGNGAAALPSEDTARKALESALAAWQGGGKPGALAGTEPAVEVHDTPWAKGAKLTSYEIIDAKSVGVEKQFQVRLTLAKPGGVQEARYHVFGLGPVMVFRDEDYLRNVNMEDGPKASKAAGSQRRRK